MTYVVSTHSAPAHEEHVITTDDTPGDVTDDAPGLTSVDAQGRVDVDAATVLGQQVPPAVVVDRDLIVATAVEDIERSGVGALTLRRVSVRLEVDAAALYPHVPAKDDLLIAVAEWLAAQMLDEPTGEPRPTDGWQDFVQRLAHGVRRVALAYPRSFPLVASRPPAAPWLRPPLGDLDWVETFLAGLIACGFSDEGAVASYRAFSTFLLGHLLLEVSTMGADIGPLDVLDDGGADDERLHRYPTVTRLRVGLREDHAATEFEEALEQLLDRMAAIRAEDA